jgi:hypothetical protein
MRIFDNEGLRITFGPSRDRVKITCLLTTNTVWIPKSRRMRWVEHGKNN